MTDETAARLQRKIAEALDHPDYFGSMVLLDSELQDVLALLSELATARHWQEKLAKEVEWLRGRESEFITAQHRAEKAEAELGVVRGQLQEAREKLTILSKLSSWG